MCACMHMQAQTHIYKFAQFIHRKLAVWVCIYTYPLVIHLCTHRGTHTEQPASVYLYPYSVINTEVDFNFKHMQIQRAMLPYT